MRWEGAERLIQRRNVGDLRERRWEHAESGPPLLQPWPLSVWLSGMVSRSLHANDPSPQPQLVLFFDLLNGGFISEPAICSINT